VFGTVNCYPAELRNHYNAIKNFKRIAIYYLSPDYFPGVATFVLASYPHYPGKGRLLPYSKKHHLSCDLFNGNPVFEKASNPLPDVNESTMEDTTGRTHKVSVLYVDDEPALLNVSKIYLERRTDISVTIAGSVTEALRLLETCLFDVIISDYQMPGTDGIGFLKILKENQCSIPFILFTGRGREEVVIEAINNGATYYIQKGGDPKSQFAELDHKIREACRRHKAEKGLQQVELCYATLFEHSGTAVVTLDKELIIRQVNSEFSRISGFASPEVNGILRWTDLVDERDADRIRNLYNLISQRGNTAEHQFPLGLIRKDRKICPISATIAIIPTTGWSIVSFIDQTYLCRLEENLQKNCPGPGSQFRHPVGRDLKQAENA
jgi:PAS domain S-box-containing protein